MTLFAVDQPLPCTPHSHLFDTHEPGRHPDITASYHAAALEICAGCPIETRLACREWALREGPLDDSIIGGLTGQQREHMALQTGRISLTPRQISGECRRGHPAHRRRKNSDGWLRCRDCENENNRRRRADKRREAAA